MKTIKELAEETGVSKETVRRAYHQLPAPQRRHRGATLAVDEKGEELLVERLYKQKRHNRGATKTATSEIKFLRSELEYFREQNQNLLAALAASQAENRQLLLESKPRKLSLFERFRNR
jgi:DNA-binding transcriptional regulator YhcF (GntR family)